MNVAIEKLPECRAKISAEVTSDEVENTRNGVVQAFMHQAKLPGFRPGKLPEKVVETKFKKAIEDELRERLSREVLSDAHSNHDLAIIGVSKVEREVFESDGTFSYVSEVVVEPEVELTEEDYKDIPVSVVKTEITQEMIDQFLRKRAAAISRSTKISTIPPREGDQAVITYEATRDGQPLDRGFSRRTSRFSGSERMNLKSIIPEKGSRQSSRNHPGSFRES